MATYTVIERGRDTNGLILHDVKRDSEIIMVDVGYSEAHTVVESEIRPGDIYQECVGDDAPYATQTFDKFQAELEFICKFYAGEL